jgi:hypothetical protein
MRTVNGNRTVIRAEILQEARKTLERGRVVTVDTDDPLVVELLEGVAAEFDADFSSRGKCPWLVQLKPMGFDDAA